MRHKKDTCKLGRSTSHRRCLTANMLKSLIHSGGIKTTLAKAKVLRRYADKMITLAKKNTLAARRQAIAEMMISFNSLSDKEERAARNGDKSAYNIDRQVIDQLFGTLGPRFANRQGGYTRILKTENRRGDNASTCYIEYLAD